MPQGFIKTINFGDGTQSDINNSEILHNYSKPGKHYILTTYQNPLNASCSQVGIDSIIVPVSGVDITADKTVSCKAPFLVNFQAQNIKDGASYSWEFGDGTTSQDIAPEKTFANKGNYQVTLTVVNTSGCYYSIQKSNFINIGPLQTSFTSDGKRIQTLPNEYNEHPIADPSVLEGGCAPFLVNFKIHRQVVQM